MQHQEQEIVVQKQIVQIQIEKKGKYNFLERCARMSLQVSSFSFTSTLVIMFLTWFLLFYVIVVNQILKLKTKELMTLFLSQNVMVLYCISISLKLLIVINLIAKLAERNINPSKKGLLMIVLPYIPIIIQLDFSLSALLFYQSFAYGFTIFCISAVFVNIQSVFLSNSFAFNFTSYISSSRKNLELRLLSIFGWIFLSLSSFNDLKVLNIIIIFALYSSSLFFWYLYKGYTLFVNKRLRKILLLMISASITLSLVIIQMCFLRNPLSLKDFLIKYIGINMLIVYCLRSTLKQEKNRYAKMSLEQINYEFYQNKQNDLDYNAWILEFIKVTNRQNKQFLDSKDTKDIELFFKKQNILMKQEQKGDEENIDIELSLKKMISQRYKILLTHKSQLYHYNSSQNTTHYKNKLLLEYGRFLLNQSGNFNKSSLVLSKIELENLYIFERISVYQLKAFIQQKYLRIDHGKELKIQLMFEFERVYEYIWMIMRGMIRNYSNAYSYLNNQQIDTDEFKDLLDKIIQKQIILNQLHHQNQQFCFFNHKFLFLYAFYKIFLTNNKICKKQIQVENRIYTLLKEDNHLPHHDSLFNKQNIIFVCKNQYQHLLITNINRQFRDILLYKTQEVLSKPVQILMNSQVACDHQRKISKILLSEEESNYAHQNNHFIQTFCLDKYKSLISVTKYYKFFISNASQVEFLCLMNCFNLQNNINKIHLQLKQKDQNIENISINKKEKYQKHINLNDKSIFYKQNNQLPRQQSLEISNIKVLMICFLILLSCVIIGLHNIFEAEINNLRVNLNNYMLIFKCYRQPIGVGTIYLRSIVKIGNETILHQQINQMRQSFRNLSAESGVRSYLLKKKINLKNDYYPLKGSRSMDMDMNLTYDQIDLFFLIQSQIVSLYPPIDINSQEFQIFNHYIIPAYDNLINGTKLQFHYLYQQSIVELKIKIWLILIQQSIIVLIFIFFFIKIIFTFKLKHKLILDTLLNLPQDQLYHIIQFWKSKQAQLLDFRNEQIQKAIQEDITFNNQNSGNLNRKKKHILPSTIKIKGKFIFIISGFMFISIVITILYSNITYIAKLNLLANFQEQGFIFFKYFPIMPIVNYGLFNKYAHSLFPKNISFDNDVYFQRINTMDLFGSAKYVTKNEELTSLFSQRKRNYFYGNPCAYNPKILSTVGTNQSTCESVFQGTFKNGLASFFRSTSKVALDYFNNITTMNPAGLSQFNLVSTICAAYILDLITLFNTEYDEKLSQLKDYLLQSVIITLCLIGLLSIIIFSFLLAKFNKQHKYHNKLFKNMIPSEYLIQQKVVRQQFINKKIL